MNGANPGWEAPAAAQLTYTPYPTYTSQAVEAVTEELITEEDASQNEHHSYGLIAECLDGRVVWQTVSTHDYKDQEMISLWQNYIYNTLQARYDYLYE